MREGCHALSEKLPVIRSAESRKSMDTTKIHAIILGQNWYFPVFTNRCSLKLGT